MDTHASKPAHQEVGILRKDDIAGLSGLEQLSRIVDGRFPTPPMAEHLGFRMMDVSEGRAVFEGTPRSEFLNPLGTVHGGWAATVLDSALACSVHTTLPAGEAYTTLEIKVNLVRPILEASGRLTADGTVIHRGRRTATAEAKLTDEAGRLFAHATTTCLIFPAA